MQCGIINYYAQKNVNSHTFGVLADSLKIISKICCSKILGMGLTINLSTPLTSTEQQANFCTMRCTGMKREGPHVS